MVHTHIHSIICLLFALLMVLVSGCVGPEAPPKPENLIEEDVYIDLVVEMQHITTYRNALPDIISADSLKSIVFQKYEITEEQFIASHKYYQHQVESHISRIERAIERIESEKLLIESHIDSVKKIQGEKDSLALPDSAG